MKYVILGYVVDEKGHPVAGAALRIDGQTVFTDSNGHFSLRERKGKEFAIEILFDQFMFPGIYQLVSAPPAPKASTETEASTYRIVLRRIK